LDACPNDTTRQVSIHCMIFNAQVQTIGQTEIHLYESYSKIRSSKDEKPNSNSISEYQPGVTRH
ncbi:unnamed protein product, partial [Allacma fusca]